MARDSERHNIWRFDGGGFTGPTPDDLAGEEPLEIRVCARPVSITMRTPGEDEALALGFLVGEGVVRSREDVAHVRRCADNPGSGSVDVLLSHPEKIDFASLTRHVFASSSCGICGSASIEAVQRRFPTVAPGLCVRPEVLAGLPGSLRQAQPAFDRTGGLHAAALFDAEGRRLTSSEDVGRHNAVDKVVGRSLLENRIPLSGCVLLVSGRASFEIVQKGAAAGVPIVAAVSAPSSLAVDLAEECGITLVGFLRGERFNVYSHPERVVGCATR